MTTMPKPGIRTTEFWIAITAAIGAFFAGTEQHIPAEWVAVASAISVGAYVISRGIAKNSSILKTGWRTTEFWLVSAYIIASVGSAIQGVLPEQVAVLCGALVAGLYAVGRGITKR